MNLLAVETSTRACSAALLIAGEIRERSAMTAQGHSDLILNMLNDLLTDADIALTALDAVAFGRGPGSFTGVRIGVGAAQGIVFARDLPALPVSSLAALAQASGEEKVLAAMDARMGEVYWGVYTRGADNLVVPSGREQVCAPEAVPLVEGGDWYGVGTGWDSYNDLLHRRLDGRVSGWQAACYPSARAVAQLGAAAFARGESVAAEQALPVYLRNKVAGKSNQP